MLTYSSCHEIDNSLVLDEILYDGDTLYKHTINNLKAQAKFVHSLLSLEEIPDIIKIEKGQFTVEKQPIVSGILVNDYEEHGLPTLHCALQSAFTRAPSILLVIEAVCSAVSKKNDLYVFFDSHSHGKNGLSSSDGSSILMIFFCLEDLISYLYALYDSMAVDMSLQFDLMPVTVKRDEQMYGHKNNLESLLEAYFNDQNLRQQGKAQSNENSTSASKESSQVKKKKGRKQYYMMFKRNVRKRPGVLAKERAQKQLARQDPNFKARERTEKKFARQDPKFKANELVHQRSSKQSARKRPGTLEKERTEKQLARQDPNFNARERAEKKLTRQDPKFKARERAEKKLARQDPNFKARERAKKMLARQDPNFKARERAEKKLARQDPKFKANELVHQRSSKQNARKRPGALAKERMEKRLARQDPNFKARERAEKKLARQDPNFKAKELVYQHESKQKIRKDPFVQECERVKQQQNRKLKRKLDDAFELSHCNKQCKIDEKNLYHNKSHNLPKQKHFNIKECIKQFHSSITLGPLFVCTCCHQTWFRKSVSMLKNINISAKSVKLYCTQFISINNEEWVCHTCLGALRDGKVPKLSLANGMKWPNRPLELDLHQLEERLIALRIPFMQIRELPRGGQYSLKGNVINVPVDIQPTVSCLPRPMDENFTIAVQLKKKLSYKKVDFKENVRPLRVLTALHWLVNKSELYKKSGIVVDDNWFQEVTESAEDTVREFLEVSKQVKEKHKENSLLEQEVDKSSLPKDRTVTDEYDFDHFSEIDSNEQVGNVDTLVDDANLENKYDQVFTFAPGEGQHPLSLYHDVDAEYLCFPTIFCGQKRPSKEERTIPVHYSDIVKWELRSVDRRAAQSVPNIFFKHKKLQMKQISDKVNLAVRRCKRKGKKITAAEARNSEYLDKLVNLDEGYYIFRQLRNSPAYLEARKKDIFAMIRQLSLPTWFMSLSAADTRWTDLLKMLAKLNNGVDYSDKDLEGLTWQEKTRLVQKDPVTCSRYFDHRVQEFLNTILKSDCEPIGKLRDFFYRVEFQQRGSPHIHMLVWIENAPTLEKNSEEEIVQFVDQYLTCSAATEDTAHLVEL